MGIKSRYREKFAEEIPAIPPSVTTEPAADAVTAAINDAAKADEASLRLRQQLADLQRSEQLQQRAAMQQRPMTHNEKLESWRVAGMSDGDCRFLAENPQMVEHDRLTAVAANQAAQEGHQRDSDSHRQRTRELFDQHLRQMHAQAPTPEFFQPKPPPEPSPEPERAAIYSAPVSREVPSGGYREPSPASIRLTIEQREVARLAGISEVEYARQFAKLSAYKRTRGVEHE